VLAAAQIIGVRVQIYHASNNRDLDTVFASLVESHVPGLIIGSDIFYVTQSERIADLAFRHAVPAVFQGREFVTAGGLMSYGNDNTEACRIAGVYAGRILKGDKPSDLPVQEAITVELIVNLKTAKVLGLTVPITMLGRADEVIE
jgi:putative ABC transport system substrate-binding protein